jgi:hypothetical protein
MTLLSLTFALSICCSRLRQSANDYCQSIFRSATYTPVRKKVVSLMYRRVIYTQTHTHTHTHTIPQERGTYRSPSLWFIVEHSLWAFINDICPEGLGLGYWVAVDKMQKKQTKLIAVITPLIDHFLIVNPDFFHSKWRMYSPFQISCSRMFAIQNDVCIHNSTVTVAGCSAFKLTHLFTIPNLL